MKKIQPTNYNLRENYENYYIKLCKEADTKPITYIKTVSTQHLLLLINELLIKLNCIPMNENDFKINLV